MPLLRSAGKYRLGYPIFTCRMQKHRGFMCFQALNANGFQRTAAKDTYNTLFDPRSHFTFEIKHQVRYCHAKI